MSFRSDPEFDRLQRLVLEQAQQATVTPVGRIILEIRGIFTGHTPESEHEHLCAKITRWIEGVQEEGSRHDSALARDLYLLCQKHELLPRDQFVQRREP